jgi:hypothetical protein
MGMPELTADMSTFMDVQPQRVAVFSMLRQYEKYFDNMVETYGADGATAAIIISCPETEPRKEMWRRYLEARGNDGDKNKIMTASVIGVGLWYQYMSNALGLNTPKANAPKDITSNAGSSPKKFIAIAIHRLYEKYFDFMMQTYGADGAAAVMMISCPDAKERELMWNTYLSERDNSDPNLSEQEKIMTASVSSLGVWYQHMCIELGLSETTTGGG